MKISLFKPLQKLFTIEATLVILVGLFLTILFTYPAITTLSSQFYGDGSDNYEFSSYIGLAAKHIKEGSYPFHITNFWRYPVGFDFARSFDSYLVVVTGALLHLVLSLPTAYNITIMIILTLNGICSYIAFRNITHSKLLGLVGMVMYGYGFHTIAKSAGHANLLFSGGLSLFLLAFINVLRKPILSQKDFFFLFGTGFLTAFASSFYLVLLVLCFVFALPFMFIFYPKTVRAFLIKLYLHRTVFALPLLITVVAFLVIYAPHLGAALGGKYVLAHRDDLLGLLSPTWKDYIFPNTYFKLYISQFISSGTTPSMEKAVFIGWVEIVLLFGFFVSRFPLRFKAFLGSFITLLILFSFGDSKDHSFFLLPYKYLAHTFPFRILIETGRYYMVFYLLITLAVVLFLTKIKKKLILYPLAVITLVLLIGERLPSTPYFSPDFTNDKFIDVVKNQDTGGVLDLPIDISYRRYNIYSLFYNKPVVNGYFHWQGDGTIERSFINDNYLNRYICLNDTTPLNYEEENSLDQQLYLSMKSSKINTVVVHKDNVYYHPVCDKVRARISNFIRHIATPELTAENQLKELKATVHEGKPSFSFYFEHDGVFYLDASIVAPSSPTRFILASNMAVDENSNVQLLPEQAPVQFSYDWDIDPVHYSAGIRPQYEIQFPVKAGGTLSFYSPDEMKQATLFIWYRYVKTPNGQTVKYSPPFEKVYEDEKAIIYKVN